MWASLVTTFAAQNHSCGFFWQPYSTANIHHISLISLSQALPALAFFFGHGVSFFTVPNPAFKRDALKRAP
jgi:hypothetical protein